MVTLLQIAALERALRAEVDVQAKTEMLAQLTDVISGSHLALSEFFRTPLYCYLLDELYNQVPATLLKRAGELADTVDPVPAEPGSDVSDSEHSGASRTGSPVNRSGALCFQLLSRLPAWVVLWCLCSCCGHVE